jgi:hypothetical protein
MEAYHRCTARCLANAADAPAAAADADAALAPQRRSSRAAAAMSEVLARATSLYWNACRHDLTRGVGQRRIEGVAHSQLQRIEAELAASSSINASRANVT